ncbi:MAG TPA: orotidine-5'-phosphate decarboxylase [Solirubrobacteraceae bacterium]|jgi:orotidine-5'-phosphate decarboxylase|nr:orotidine-5'-phosphate decarboxylase [Solirubrobacteraceae bacterium]
MPGAGSIEAPGPVRTPQPFGERLAAAVAARESQIVLGIDPDPARLWRTAGRADQARPALAAALAAADDAARAAAGGVTPSPGAGAAVRFDAAAAVLAHCLALIDAAGPACVAIKPQLACFERLGFAGWLVLERACAHARDAGLLVLADGKRGDVPVTAAVYAQAFAGLGADAFTANPLLGRDALDPLVQGARSAGAGVFALVRTSNPGAADVLDLRLEDGSPLWEHLARMVADLGAGELADVGAVTGATAPEHLVRMRELMPRTPFLLPGVGAQGGDVADLAPAFAPGRAAGLVTASRSIANAGETSGTEPGPAARAEAERLRQTAWSLA